MKQGQGFAINRRFTVRKCTVQVENNQSFQRNCALLWLRADKEAQLVGDRCIVCVGAANRRRSFFPYVRSITGIDCRGSLCDSVILEMPTPFLSRRLWWRNTSRFLIAESLLSLARSREPRATERRHAQGGRRSGLSKTGVVAQYPL